MYLKRSIDSVFLEWKETYGRKPLLVRGARQVGKTAAVRHAGELFDYFIELNFDENPGLRRLFDSELPVNEICEQISLLFNTPVIPGRTLLFLDEIQSCKSAIGSLRYFYEKMPGLHVIAAGSLLEFALSEVPSFGVGRIRSVFLFPLSFREFLAALREEALLEYMQKHHFKNPLPEPFHRKLILLHQKFLIIGGMPEVVRAYSEGKSLLEIQRLLDDLIISVQADFDKYKARVPSVRLIEVFQSVAAQTGSKFVYNYPASTLNHLQVKECLQLLQMAGLIHPVVHSSANGIPLGAQANPKRRKFLMPDTGIFQRMLGLEAGRLILDDAADFVNKGMLAELHTGLEILKNGDPFVPGSLYYWHRESRNSQAELDYIVQHDSRIVPIEVKAGLRGRMVSLRLFLQEKKLPFGIRISSENFADMDSFKILPVYALHLLRNLLDGQKKEV